MLAGEDVLLDVEQFDMAATRPPLTFGLPHNLFVCLIFAGCLWIMFYDTGDWINDLIGDAVGIVAIGMVASTARLLLRTDYHGWGNALAWSRLDLTCLDTREWGGAHLASLPLRSTYRCGPAR